MLQFLYNKKNINNINKVTENKSFVLNYPKFFIRNSLNNINFILDNSLEISTSIKNNRINQTVYSIVLNKTLYTHKFYKNLKFYWFNPNVYIIQKIKSYLFNINLKHCVFFIKITRGGVEAYSNGFRGILPKEQLFVLINQKKKHTLSYKLNFVINQKKKSKFVFFKAPVELIKINAYPAHSSSLLLNRSFNTLNIIFSCSSKLTTNENKKNNKKNRKSYYRKKYKKI